MHPCMEIIISYHIPIADMYTYIIIVTAKFLRLIAGYWMGGRDHELHRG